MKKKTGMKWLGLLAAGLLGLWPTAGLRAQGVATMADTETSAETVKCDTIRLTWEAKAGEEKSFSFKSVLGGCFTIHWGVGEKTTDVFWRGNGTCSHTYAKEGRYEVWLCGMPYEKPVGQGEDYVETAFGMEMRMVYVQGGTFSMGSKEKPMWEVPDDIPVHSVTLSDFYIGQYEVTQAQWEAVMGTTIYQQQKKTTYRSLYGVGDNYPMYYVSWEEAQAFCAKLSEATGKTYRLPTEAEWEYAARGGQNNDGTKYAGSNEIGEVAWSQNVEGKTHPVGQKRPNGLGLYDMSGNVFEWCSDWYDSDYYRGSPEVNPQGPSDPDEWYLRVMRGGGWYYRDRNCRVSYRGGRDHGYCDFVVGFRVVCVP